MTNDFIYTEPSKLIAAPIPEMAASEYQPGDMVPFHFNAGIIIGSYVVSLMGAVTTVELLHRRTISKHWTLIRALHQLAISVSFGLVAIWCMHFIGNRAIVLGDGAQDLQLSYNGGFTVLSAIIPIVALFAGFTLVELHQPGQRLFWPLLIVAGAVAGASICAMHYIGNLGISNYKLHFEHDYVLGAALIAIGASVAALTLFFYFKERWINSVPRRLFCACVIAGAVSGMHWTASRGTKYVLRDGQIQNGKLVQHNNNVTVAVVLCLLSCFISLVGAFLVQRRERELAKRPQHIAVASAIFDEFGSILVTQDGFLPSQVIMENYNAKSFENEFDLKHPVFQWLFRLTFNWNAVVDFIPAMREHLRAISTAQNPARPITPGEVNSHLDRLVDYAMIFREHFCVAAAALADKLKMKLTDLGILFTMIMTTGTSPADTETRRNTVVLDDSHDSDPEIGEGINNSVVAVRGQLLFLVQRVDRHEALRLKSEGYRFAEVQRVIGTIARKFQVPRSELNKVIKGLHKYCLSMNLTLTASSYLTVFAMRASFNPKHGCHVLVPTSSPCSLPMVELNKGELEAWQQEVLDEIDGLRVHQCLDSLSMMRNRFFREEEREWIQHLDEGISTLMKPSDAKYLVNATFSSKAVKAAGIGGFKRADGAITHDGTVNLFVFCIIPDIHESNLASTEELSYVPLSFFKCGQRVYPDSPDHTILARQTHREFVAVLANWTRNSAAAVITEENLDRAEISNELDHSEGSAHPNGNAWFPARIFTPHTPDSRSGSITHAQGQSQVALVRNSDGGNGTIVVEPNQWSGMSRSASFASRTGSRGGCSTSARQYGAIMVSSDTTIENDAIEMDRLGASFQTGQDTTEHSTYADELVAMTTARWSAKRGPGRRPIRFF